MLNYEIVQMVERQTVEPEFLGSNQAAGEFFCDMLQRVTSLRVYKIPTKWMNDLIWCDNADEKRPYDTMMIAR